MSTNKEKKRLLDIAILCEQDGDTCQAASLYGDILTAESPITIKQILNSPNDNTILHQAYQGLLRMAASKDECTWEMASQILGDLRAMFE